MGTQLWHIYSEFARLPFSFQRKIGDYLLEMQAGGLKSFSILRESTVGFGAEMRPSAPKIS
jgi:hypothetical protein